MASEVEKKMLEDLRAVGVIVEVCLGCGKIDCDSCPAGSSTSINLKALSFEASGKLRDILAERRGDHPQGKDFLIQDRRSYAGDAAIFWRPDGKGYTQYVDQAGVYSKEDADRTHENRPTDVPVPVEVARRCARNVVDSLSLTIELKKLL